MRLRWPFSTTVTRSFSAFATKVATFLEALRRPLGLPDCPFLNRLCRGGLPLPTTYSCSFATARILRPLGFELIERFASSCVASVLARIGLPTPHDCVDVARIQFEAEAAPAGALGRDHRSAAAKKAVEHDITASGTIQDRIRDQSHRFHGRMQSK